MDNSESGDWKIGVALSVALLLAFCGWYYWDDFAPNPSKQECETAVAERLRSPASASFTYDVDTRNFMSGSVDSQNGFGAVLRSEFECFKNDGPVSIKLTTPDGETVF